MSWKTVRLGALLQPSRKFVQIDPRARYKQITVRLWGKGLSLRAMTEGLEIAADKQVAVSAGDFLISKIDARHGAFGIVPAELDGALVSSDFPCFVVDAEAIDPRFLNWYSKTRVFIDLCKEASRGSTNRVRLKERVFLNLEISIPPLDEQRRIASYLDQIRASLVERQAQLDSVERDARSMLFNAFQRIASNVEYKPLSEVAPLERRPVGIEPDAEYPELGARSFGRGLFHKPTVLGANITWQKLFWVHKGDLVFSNIKAWEGAFGVASQDDHMRVGSHRYLTCAPNPKLVTPNFVWFYLQTPEGLQKVGRASPGSADRNRTLGQAALMAIDVPVARLEAQQQFDILCSHVTSIRQIRSETTRDVDALVPAILHDVFEQRPIRLAKNAASSSVALLPKKAGIDTPFKEAVLVGALVKAFADDDNHALGNFRLQKGVYFARRHMGERSLDHQFLRKAAGPYNPSMRYVGGIRIAEEKKWIARLKTRHGVGSALGPNAEEMTEWIETYGFARVVAWVRDKFKLRKNQQWELLATVDYAKLALEASGSLQTAVNILAYIEADDEWRPKVENLRLSKASINNALAELEALFPN